MTPVTAFVAIGSNLGNRRQSIDDAISELRHDPKIEVIRVSTLLENAAVGGPDDSPAFLNGVISLQTTHSAESLLQCLLHIESALGRVRRQRWEPRVIDLDLLLYGDCVLQTEALTLPHPRLEERRFVLQPLAEIAPNLRLPKTGERVSDLLKNLND